MKGSTRSHILLQTLRFADERIHAAVGENESHGEVIERAPKVESEAEEGEKVHDLVE